jgi:hypothetical protein
MARTLARVLCDRGRVIGSLGALRGGHGQRADAPLTACSFQPNGIRSHRVNPANLALFVSN